jgi:hypothetical protein
LIRLFRDVRDGWFQTSRLDPRASKCRLAQGHFGVVCGEPQHDVADFHPIGIDHDGLRRIVVGLGRVSGAATVALATALSVVLLSAGCTNPSGDRSEPSGSGGGGEAATPAAVETQVSFGEITGKLGRPAREQLSADVQSVVDGWLDAAYVGGDYPRTDFAASWPGFTKGAQADATGDADLMSNQDVGADIDGVEPVGRALRIDVLAVKRKPVGVTAHVILKFDTTGSTEERVKVAGRLYLTKDGGAWQVFGYDVTKGAI